MKSIILSITILLFSLPAFSAEFDYDMNSWVKKNTVKTDIIDFGYLIQSYGIGYYNLSKSFIYCVDVKNKMMVSAEPNVYIKKDTLKGEKQADIILIYDEAVIPAGETRSICLKLEPPKEPLKEGVYNAFGAILLNKTKALGFRMKYEVVSAVQDTILEDTDSKAKKVYGLVRTTDGDIKSSSGVPSIVLDDKQPLSAFAIDFFELVGGRYIFDSNFKDIFNIDKRTTCNIKEKMRDVTCPPPLNPSVSDCAEKYYEISQESNKNQCYVFFKKKSKGRSNLTINMKLIGASEKPIDQEPIELMLEAR